MLNEKTEGFMFVYTCRANTIKFFACITAALMLLTGLVIFLPSYGISTTAAISAANEKISFDKVKTDEDRINFLKQFGWEVEAAPKECVEITIPSDFDKILNQYNEIQKQQGLDLSKYRGKDVTRYTYIVKNYPNYSGTVYANVIIYKNRVIGGDVCSADVEGFIGTLRYPA